MFDDALMTLFCAQPIVDIENVIVILVVIAFVVRRFARFCQHTPGIVSGFVSELRVANVISVDKVGGNLLQRL